MPLSPDLTLAERALDELEQIEARALVWGLVDNALSDDEVYDALDRVLNQKRNAELRDDVACSITTARDLRDLLVTLHMLFKVPDTHSDSDQDGSRWRTRMAEGVRLIARLRQMFPQHARDPHSDTQWTGAPTLVADYRFLRRARRYPERDQQREAVMGVIDQSVTDPALLSAVRHWLDQMPAGAGMSRFQVDAAARILGGLGNRTRTGTLVSAGTGSGKTLAFYLPALAWLAQQRLESPKSSVRVLALYPRNELLKDQLAEVFDQCRKFDDWIATRGGAALRVGVLYGETPETRRAALQQRGWRSIDKRESVCPFFTCPKPGCGSEMAVRAEDAECDRLVCRKCGESVESDRLAFTREGLAQDPPDVLFTSVEMLNRHLSNPKLRHLFGVGPKAIEAPGLVLMDEVHLYSGTYGAQVAYLMRRWWSVSGRRSSFVGLSATISEGKRFFASLTGLDESVVQEIKPQDDDIKDEGAEYLLALRGDPVSQAALLSTTIQTLMLAARLLDPHNRFDKNSNPFFGWRAFAFTDQLDAANRLFRNLLDAEGRYLNGHPNVARHREGGLARLRMSREPAGRRYDAGQDWRVPEKIGHELNTRLEVARTTALDSGVSSASEIVVATAALEVGFDDPAVGVVVQHKAPRDIASFLQRKGRAGRTRHMRPWTMVVLTDYGRDRLAYQSYDTLFDPELPARQLPLTNRYVQRMQSVYALLDELGDMTHSDPLGIQVWRDMKGPPDQSLLKLWEPANEKALKDLLKHVQPDKISAQITTLRAKAKQLAPKGRYRGDSLENSGWYWLKTRLAHKRLHELLKNLLTRPDAAERLAATIQKRLAIPREDTDILLWNQPRPLLLGAVPTAMRRLQMNWQSKGAQLDFTAGHPLPDYIPAYLFDDLSLPEMRLALPGDGAGSHYLPVQQALGEFAPGRVSRRYDDALWLGVSAQTLNGYLDRGQDIVKEDADVADWYETYSERPFHCLEDGKVVEHLAFRPASARLQPAPARNPGLPDLNDTSNAQLRWSSHVEAPRDGAEFRPPEHIGVSRLIGSIVAHTHAGQSAALVRRYAIASRAEMSMRLGNATHRLTVDWRFMHDGKPAGVGFEIDADALLIVLNLPAELHKSIDWSDEARVRAARAARYNWEAQHCPSFVKAVSNPFLRMWIAQIFQIAAILVATEEQLSLMVALNEVASGARMTTLLGVLSSVFQLPETEPGDEGPDRLRQSLKDALGSPDIRLAARDAARVLVTPIDAEWEAWLSRTLRVTLGAACLEAIQQACPQVDAEGLIVDIEPGIRLDGVEPQRAEIWISETSPGGNGMIEQVVELLASRPDSFYRHIEAALEASDLESTNTQLKQLVEWLGGNDRKADIAAAVMDVRNAASPITAQLEFARLRAELVRHGHAVFHGYAVALSLRMLRPGSPEEIDRLIAEIHAHWVRLEQQHGIEIDVRVMCAVYSRDTRLDAAFASSGLVLPLNDRESWRFGVLMGLLWPQGHALRAVNLPLSNRFAPNVATERLLLGQWLTQRRAPIDPSEPGWLERAHEQLITHSEAVFAVAAVQAHELVPALIRTLTVEPIQFDYLNVFATLASIRRRDDTIELHFSIPECA
ncbi:protein DpdJ [Paraburkholderia terrae]|uniref:protein DpdJ n=1 Tax=Paraburkholderia terrae TaxID=311230 RepID=UPI001EE2E2C2|nr:protein DpdJ [Paraburkholderia terrae]GJG99175.1 DEAD/DEAH box helicase [Paraburkholderia terrae]